MSYTDDEKTYALFNTGLNKNIINGLKNKETKFFLFPPLETAAVPLNVKTSSYLKNITAFDWLIFTDVFAVDYFLQRLGEIVTDYFELDAIRVCAFGEAVADRLRYDQLHADVIPQKLTSHLIFSDITAYVGEENLSELKLLAVKEEKFDIGFNSTSLKKVAEIKELNVYRANISDHSEMIKLATLIKSGAIDEFIISSPEDLIALRYYFPSEPETYRMFSEIRMAAVDGNIFRLLKENNYKPFYFLDNREN